MSQLLIQAIVLDVDGVLTDGRLYMTEAGETMKVFHVHDGSAIKSWRLGGGLIALLSGRESPIVTRRAAELGIETVHQGVVDKLERFQDQVAAWAIDPRGVCYVGDDTPDIAPMQACGFPVAVANAVDAVKRHAAYTTRCAGGGGAVGEIIHYLLKVQSNGPGWHPQAGRGPGRA